jgi:hypothetical protein
VGALLGILAAIVFESPYGLFLSGISLVASGVAAIRGGKSAVTRIGVTSSAGSAGLSWSTRELESMSPEQRSDHASLTGSFVVLMGCGFLALPTYYGWTRFLQHRAAAQYEAMAEAAGLVSTSAPEGSGLGASPQQVCWGGYAGAVICNDASLGGAPVIRVDLHQADELVSTPLGFVLASNREVTWLASVTAQGAIYRSTHTLYQGGGKALTSVGTRVAWVTDRDVVVANLASNEPLESPEVVGQVTDAKQPVLALSADAVWYGPTESCSLARQGTERCGLPREQDLCAVSSSSTQLVALTKSGELWRSQPGPETKFARLAAELSGCLLAVNDRFAYVAGPGPVARVDLGKGSQAVIFREEPAQAIAISDRSLYFRTARKVLGIRLDAPPL